MLRPTTCEDSLSVIGLRESVAGRKRSDSLDGQMMLPFGVEAALASPLAQPASEKAKPTSGTCGPSSDASLRSASLQESLANKLQARMGASGSPEFVLTWKHWDMGSGPPICALRASARRTSDSDCGGWATPAARDWRDGRASDETMDRNSRPLNEQATMLAGWTSPRASEIGRTRTPEAIAKAKLKGGSSSLEDQVHLASWATPRAEDSQSAGMRHSRGTADTLSAQAGQHLTLSPVVTERIGVLNPALSRWLQGYPSQWDEAAPSWNEWQSVQRELTEQGD
jgi:hypothetical protein